MNYLINVTLSLCSLMMGLFGFVDGYNMFIVPVNFADGMTMLEGFGVMLVAAVVFVRIYDFPAALDRVPSAEKLSSDQKGIIIHGVRTLVFFCVWVEMYLYQWVIS